jgi:hypothetical protein
VTLSLLARPRRCAALPRTLPARRPMARSRRLISRSVLGVFCAGTLMAAVLTGIVALANSVVTLRGQIADLREQCSYLEAHHALRLTEWHRLSGRDAVVARARGLGLILRDDPGPVILVRHEPPPEDVGEWRRFLSQIGGGDRVPAVAAQSR